MVIVKRQQMSCYGVIAVGYHYASSATAIATMPKAQETHIFESYYLLLPPFLSRIRELPQDSNNQVKPQPSAQVQLQFQYCAFNRFVMYLFCNLVYIGCVDFFEDFLEIFTWDRGCC